MSTTKKQTKKQNVETVDISVKSLQEIQKCFEYIYTTLEFWKLTETYPGNLLHSVCVDFAFQVENILHENENKEIPF